MSEMIKYDTGNTKTNNFLENNTIFNIIQNKIF